MIPNPMDTIISKAEKTFDSLNEAVQAFEMFLQNTDSSVSAQYYKGRDALKQGESFFREVFKNVRKFLGPPPDYTAPAFIQYKEKVLSEENILTHSVEKNELFQELVDDNFLSGIMSEDEIRFYLDKYYESQQDGKRKLENIKARIIIDKLQDLIESTKELQKRALQKLQSLPY